MFFCCDSICMALLYWSESFLLNRAIKEEKYAARRAILPIIQAEEDERWLLQFASVILVLFLNLLALKFPIIIVCFSSDSWKNGRSIWRRRQESWKMCLVGKWAKAFTTQENGCLQPPVSYVPTSGNFVVGQWDSAINILLPQHATELLLGLLHNVE